MSAPAPALLPPVHATAAVQVVPTASAARGAHTIGTGEDLALVAGRRRTGGAPVPAQRARR